MSVSTATNSRSLAWMQMWTVRLSGLLLAVVVMLTIGFGLLMARMLGLSYKFGLLPSGATGICGISAAMAIAPTPWCMDDEDGRDMLMTAMGIASLSTIAMVFYPLGGKTFFEKIARQGWQPIALPISQTVFIALATWVLR